MAENARDEEFYYLLTEGSELLQAGKVDEARGHFERALTMNPTHEQALNLLGLSLFRLNQLDRARSIFADLVHNNPIEPSLRLNLAMVHLKTGRLDDAKLELERVLELSPDHPRATSYMGLVLERKGDLERAAEFYEKAGNKKRADEIRAYRPTATGTFPLPNLQAIMAATKTEQKLQEPVPSAPQMPSLSPGSSHSSSPSLAPQAQAASAAPKPISSITPISSVTPSASATNAAALTAAAAATLNKQAEPPAAAQVESARGASLGFTVDVDEKKKAAPTVASMVPTQTPSPATPSTPPTPPPAAAPATGGKKLVEHRVADLVAEAVTADEPTLRDDGILAFPVPDVGYVRTDLLISLAGQFEIEPVNRRYRGKRTDSLFGGPEAAIVALLGKGLALLFPDKLAARLVTLKSEELYLVESSLLAFTQGLVWENGRLPSETDRDLDIVHLRGSGKLVLGTKSPVLALPVRPEHPVTVHAARLVGWNGQLVPYRAPLPGLPDAARRIPVVRFEGTGVVLAV